MADRVSPEIRSANMARIRAKHTKPEVYLFATMEACGWRFRKHDSTVPGNPDATFPISRTAVFVDGDFWHGYRFPQWKVCIPPFWQEKIEQNRTRDRRVRGKLRTEGWTVIRIWEHEIERDIFACLTRIEIATGLRTVRRVSVMKQLKEMPPLKYRRRLPRIRKAIKD